MKKILLIVLCIAITLLFLVSCKRDDTTEDSTSSDTVVVTPEENAASESTPITECEHDWTLTAFITEETTIPFAGNFFCNKCETVSTRSIKYTDIDIPLINIVGDISPLCVVDEALTCRDARVDAAFSYQSRQLSFNCNAALKCQGGTSLIYEKKNFSVNLIDPLTEKKKDIAFQEEWGAGSKYVLKANYTDPSSIRNIAMASLYGQIAHTLDLDDRYASLVNCGAVDGYPVLLYVNGYYQGLYNWVIRKDKWLYGMGDESAGEAVLNGYAETFERETGIEYPLNGWEEEYVNETFGEPGWAEASFNAMLFGIKNAEEEALRGVISEYVELERTLDVMLFNSIFGVIDNISANQVWCTYDGKKWAPVPYDLDETLGRSGQWLWGAETDISEGLKLNILYEKICTAYFSEFKARYISLRGSILTISNIMNIIGEKLRGVDDRYFDSELEKWPNAVWLQAGNGDPIGSFEDELQYIETFVGTRLSCCDEYFGIEA